jgi:dTDP-3,4-didehydro-2,6-dideoxy-alpha-D-glucose 3-reductase
MRKIKIGVLGCADIAKRMIVPNLLKTNKFEIVAFGSRSIKKATEYSNLFGGKAIEGYDELIKIKEIEAIYIPLPTGLHFEWILKCLENKKHVFSEKSIANNFTEVSKIIEIAESNQLCVYENFMFPYHSQIQFVNDLIKSNEIGEIRLLKSSFGFPIFNYGTNIRYKKNLGGGALLDAGAYTLMASQLFLGKNQKVVSSCLNNLNNEVDFLGSITLLNEDNIVSQLSFGFDNFYQNNIEIWGTKGKILLDRAFTSGPDYSPLIIVNNSGGTKNYQLPKDNHFIKILNEFYSSITDGNYSRQFDKIISQANLLTQAREKNNITF